jgi:micrococcal nuclease
MKNILERYGVFPAKSQIVIAVTIFILALLVLPHAVVYALATFVSYKLIKNKILRYGVVGILCFTTLISVILLSSRATPSIQTAETVIPPQVEQNRPIELRADNISTPTKPLVIVNTQNTYQVVKVIDGDTLDVSIGGKTERIRLIGINTPETVDPRKEVECFGVEASNKSKTLLTGKQVSLESDGSQGDRDKYDRLLRYVFLEDGANFNLRMIREGYAYEYTYDLPYKYQLAFKEAQKQAMEAKAGLWGDICQTKTTATQPSPSPTPTPTVMKTDTTNSCTIKGNISSKKEKIYHVIGCGSYNQTVIDESKGERLFCSEQDAVDAGWRKAQNCT